MTPEEREDLIGPLREALRKVSPRSFDETATPRKAKQGGNNPRRKRKRPAEPHKADTA